MSDRPDPTPEPSDEPSDDGTKTEHVWDPDALADEMSEESFPTSDPPSTWGGDDRG